jgi:DNA-binding MarR family transcriptional regulator
MNKPTLTYRSDGLADLTFTLNLSAIVQALDLKAKALTRTGLRGRRPKLSPERLTVLIGLLEAGSHTQAQLAAMFDLSQPAICVLKRKHISLALEV